MQRYEIIKKLAEGGSGSTYLVWDSRLEREWVMKQVRLTAQGGTIMAERELQVLKRIHKEGIPVLTDGYEEDGYFYLLMEYMPGISLEQKVKEEGVMKEMQALECCIQTACLLDYLHSLPVQIIHGDVKPLNVMWHQGRIALLDFGTAAMQRLSRNCDVSGFAWTPGYATPELAEKGLVSVGCDIYALGALLFYLVTGFSPAHERGIFPVREENARLSKSLEAIILKCTEREAAKRYRSMKEVIAVLEQCRAKNREKSREKFLVECGLKSEKKSRKTFRIIHTLLLTEGE